MSSAAPAGAGSCSPDGALLAEVEAFITAEFGKVTEGEQVASLAAVAASGRFSKLLEDCSTDELGVRVQRQADTANKMMKQSLSLLIKQIAIKHCQNLLEEVRSTKKINVALLQENKQLRKAIQEPLKAARKQIMKELKHENDNEIRRRGNARKRVLEAGLVDAAAESPVKRAMGGVWLEATRNSKVKGGRGSKGSIMKLWTQETTSILKKLVVAADKAGD